MLFFQNYLCIHFCLSLVNELSYSLFRIYLQLTPFIIMSLSTTARAYQRKTDQTNKHQRHKVPTDEFFIRFVLLSFLVYVTQEQLTAHIHQSYLEQKNIHRRMRMTQFVCITNQEKNCVLLLLCLFIYLLSFIFSGLEEEKSNEMFLKGISNVLELTC